MAYDDISEKRLRESELECPGGVWEDAAAAASHVADPAPACLGRRKSALLFWLVSRLLTATRQQATQLLRNGGAYTNSRPVFTFCRFHLLPNTDLSKSFIFYVFCRHQWQFASAIVGSYIDH